MNVSMIFPDEQSQPNLDELKVNMHIQEQNHRESREAWEKARECNPVRFVERLAWTVVGTSIIEVNVKRDPDSVSRWAMTITGKCRDSSDGPTYEAQGSFVFKMHETLNLESYDGHPRIIEPVLSAIGFKRLASEIKTKGE